MNLYQLGKFVLNSGAVSKYKIDCDALCNEDIDTLASWIVDLVGPFGSVEGVPRGGLALAAALKPYIATFPLSFVPDPHLIVDDVLTTGGSMERLKAKLPLHETQFGVKGAVIFGRGPLPSWIKAIFPMPKELWINK